MVDWPAVAFRDGGELMLNFSVLTTSAHLKPTTVLDCATWVHLQGGGKGNPGVAMFKEFCATSPFFELPATVTIFQSYLSIKLDMVAGYDDFCELVDWLEREKIHQLVSDFDNMLSWPTIILNGLFIHMG